MILLFYKFALEITLLAATTVASASTIAYNIEIRGTINPATARYLQRSIVRAENADASLLLVELDTPGGLVSSVREMAQSIDHSKIPVVVFVTPAGAAATSAGALLVISSHLAAMSPGTSIGAAHPVGAQGEDIKGTMGEKAVNDVSAFARSEATLRGRNSAVANEIVSKSKSFSAEEAQAHGVIEVIATNRADLWRTIDQRKIKVGDKKVTLNTWPPPEVHSLRMSPGEFVLHHLAHPNIAAILVTVGVLLIYAELSAPGHFVPGILGALCLIVAFVSFQVLPIYLGGIILLAVGAALMLAEVFIVSHGALAVLGVIFLSLGLLWVIDPGQIDLRISTFVWLSTVGVLTFGSLILVWAASRIQKLSKKALEHSGGGDLAGLRGYKGQIEKVNPDGHSGVILIRGERWNFFSDRQVEVGEIVKTKDTHGLSVEIL